MTLTNTSLTTKSLAELATHSQPPFLSLYEPTHRHHPENQQDPIRFGNLVKALAASLKQQHGDDEIRLLLRPFEALAVDPDFWNHTLDGLAVLGGPGFFQVFHLPRPVNELAIVADSLHTKPLRRFLQSVDRYQVLGLGLRKIQLFEGNRDALNEIALDPCVPQTLTEALGEELTEAHQTVASYGGTGRAPMRHSHGGRKDETDIDMERFFRVIDRDVLEHHSRPSGLPLMLAALPEHHHLYRQVSHNPFLMTEGLTVNPELMPIEELRERAWQVVEPQYQARLALLADEFAAAKSKGLGSDKLEEVAQAAAVGRVATLLIEADRQLPGRLDAETGQIIAAASSTRRSMTNSTIWANWSRKWAGGSPSCLSTGCRCKQGSPLSTVTEAILAQKGYTMHIQINSGPNIQAREGLAAEVSGTVESILSRFSDHITRVEVHLSDENSDKKVGHDAMRCMMEARLEGQQPIAVTHQAETLDEAVDGSAEKLSRKIESTLGRQHEQQRQRTDPDPSAPEQEPDEES